MNVLLGIDRIAQATPWLVETSPWREDPLAIEETIWGFFDAFNGMNYERCLNYVASTVEADRERLTGLLRLARYFSGTIEIQRVTNLTVSDTNATAVVNAMVRGEATKEEVQLVKVGTGWKLLWEATSAPGAAEGAAQETQNGKRARK